MARITMERSYDAPVDVVWDVVSDHALYGTVAPNLADVSVVRDGDGRATGSSSDGGDGGGDGAGDDGDSSGNDEGDGNDDRTDARDSSDDRTDARDSSDDRTDDRDAGGEGMVRRCVDAGGNEWTERCHRWDEGREFAVTVDVADSDFHRRLFDRFEGAWRVDERDDDVLVTMQFDFETKYGPLGWLLAKYFQYRAPSLIEPIFDGWAATIARRR